MNLDLLPVPEGDLVLTHFLVVADQDRSRDFYVNVFGAEVAVERDPVILKLANSWVILNVGGGPTDDKPDVELETPKEPNRVSAFLNVRVKDIHAMHRRWSDAGASFLTEPKDHYYEWRCYIRDPDGHLIEVGQTNVDAMAGRG